MMAFLAGCVYGGLAVYVILYAAFNRWIDHERFPVSRAEPFESWYRHG